MARQQKFIAATRVVQGLAGIALMLGVWWLLTVPFSAPGAMGQRFAPGPSLLTLISLLQGGEIWIHIAVSLQRVAIGLGLALLVGVPLGLLLGASASANATLSPAFQFLRMISPLSWMPIAVMAFGIGDRPVYFLLAFAALWPIMLNTLAGVRQLDRRWLQLSKSLSATGWETLKGVIIPGILGHVLTGTRLAIGIVWIVLVPCEMLGVSAGLGYFILDTRDRLAYHELMATVVLIGLLGFLLDTAFRKLYEAWSKTR
jgi:NitT/TauT family transport system permease protein